MTEPTICACATALPAEAALLRVSGCDACAIADRAGLPVPSARRHHDAFWPMGGGICPVVVSLALAPRSYTGEDVVEILLPGSPDLVELALSVLRDAGAVDATPGAFTRRALANGRLGLDQVEAILAMTQADDAAAAQRALERLRGALHDQVESARGALIALAAAVEAGLDFAEEEDVQTYDRASARREVAAIRDRLAQWCTVADDEEAEARVVLIGAPNAGKSALFNRLGEAEALVSAIAGTTRDWLETDWCLSDGRRVRLVDTAGMHVADGLEAAAIAAGSRQCAGAALIIACAAPDAPLPADLPAGAVVIATKTDLAPPDDARAVLGVSARSGEGCGALAALVARRLGEIGGGEPRQQRLLSDAVATCDGLLAVWPDEDVLLAEDLRRIAHCCAALTGVVCDEDLLDHIFSRFCIGK